MALRGVNDGNGILFGPIRQKDIVDSVLKRPNYYLNILF